MVAYSCFSLSTREAFAQEPVAPAIPAVNPEQAPPGALSSKVPESLGPLGLIPLPERSGTSPGLPPLGGRPLPGGVLDPGASGPGIGRQTDEDFLDGALDYRTGWPFVFRDHFQPRRERLERFWVVQTRACPQVMGSDPWPKLKVLHFDDRGDLAERAPEELLGQASGRIVVIQVHGSLVTADEAVGELLWSHSWLEHNRVLSPDALVVEFDWPSERVHRNNVRDINEKGRRAYVAAYHLARFIQSFPPGTQICVIGQSYGGRVVPSALHLLGGGSLNSQDHDPPVRLPSCRPDLHIRAVILEGASDHNWLDPGQRLDRAFMACEALLNLYNRRDQALRLYPFLIRSGHRRALGRLGLTNRDFERLGPLAARYEEHDLNDLLGREHTLLDSVANPQITRWMAPYLWAADPGPPPPGSNQDRGGTPRRSLESVRSLFGPGPFGP
jgi:hypothetical protein